MTYDAHTGEELTDSDLEARYDELLDEIYGEVTMGQLSWPASQVLREMDPIAYNVGMSDWESSEIAEGIFTEEPPEDDEDDG